ncbi:MAG: 3'(2'),5'-bisphosphate nucleotidase CysQ [Alsobacter sp.]
MSLPSGDIPARVIEEARRSTRDAGQLALGYFRHGSDTTAEVSFKAGGSPVTEADLAVDALLKERLTALAPDFGWLSEETEDNPARLARRRVWIVDPIDGTRAFARGDTDWTIAVGIVEDGVPVAGFVYAPVPDEFFEASAGAPALRNGERIRATDREGLSGARLAGPKPMLDRLAGRAAFDRAPRVHSLAYRIIHVADGRIDGGLAGGRSHDWDLAAAHAVLLAAGGVLVDGFGRPPRYNRASTLQPPLAAAGTSLAPALVEAVRSLAA